MKPKVFRDAVWGFFVFVEAFYFILWSICSYMLIQAIILYINDFTLVEFGEFLLFFSGITIGALWFPLSELILPRAFGRLLIYEDKVVYRCPFRRKRTLKLEECEHIGVENYAKLNRGMPVVRGDEISFIYFSKKPYPEEFSGKITALKNSKDFIKISYTDKLAEALFEILPDNKDYLIRSFYGKMKANDRLAKIKKRNKKKK